MTSSFERTNDAEFYSFLDLRLELIFGVHKIVNAFCVRAAAYFYFGRVVMRVTATALIEKPGAEMIAVLVRYEQRFNIVKRQFAACDVVPRRPRHI